MTNLIRKYQVTSQLNGLPHYANTWEEAKNLQKQLINEFFEHTGVCQITVIYKNEDETFEHQSAVDNDGDMIVNLVDSVKWEETDQEFQTLVTITTLHDHDLKLADEIFVGSATCEDEYAHIYGNYTVQSILDERTFTYTCDLSNNEITKVPLFSYVDRTIDVGLPITVNLQNKNSYQFAY